MSVSIQSEGFRVGRSASRAAQSEEENVLTYAAVHTVADTRNGGALLHCNKSETRDTADGHAIVGIVLGIALSLPIWIGVLALASSLIG